MTQFAGVNYKEMGLFGAEVIGVDLNKGLSADLTKAIAALLLDRQLLLFRNQALSDRAFVDYASALGRLQPHTLMEFAPEGCPEILLLSNRVKDGKPVGLVEVGHFWHSDGSYLPEIDEWTTLQGIEIPRDSEGNPLGDTMFTSAVCAYDELPETLRRKVEGFNGVFSYHYRYQQRIAKNSSVKPARANSETKDVTHPVIRPHPGTGRKAIFVNEGYTTRIDGLPESESQQVLATLLRHLYSERFVYRHKWRPGDVLLWDNNSTQHNAVPNYKPQDYRLMKRITIKTAHPALARPPGNLQCA